MKNIVSIIDKNNTYPPFWEIGGLKKKELYVFYAVIIAFWAFIYYTKSLTYKTSIFVGLGSAILFTYLYNYLYNTPCFYMTDDKTNTWYKACSRTSPIITNTSKLKSIKHVNTTRFGYMVTEDYYNDMKKNKDVKQIPLYKSYLLNQYRNSKQVDQNTEPLIMYGGSSVSYQGYCLVTIMFTLLSVVYGYDVKLFEQLYNMFLYSLMLSIPFIYFWLTLYKNEELIDLGSVKIQFMFIAVSIVLSILTETILHNL